MLAYSIFRHTQVVIPEVIHFPQGFTDQFQRCQMGNWGYGHHVFEKRPYVCERCASIGTPKEMEQWISPAKSSKPYIYVYLFIYNIYIHKSFWGLLYVALESLVKHWRSRQQPNQVMVVSPPRSSGVGGDRAGGRQQTGEIQFREWTKYGKIIS